MFLRIESPTEKIEKLNGWSPSADARNWDQFIEETGDRRRQREFLHVLRVMTKSSNFRPASDFIPVFSYFSFTYQNK